MIARMAKRRSKAGVTNEKMMEVLLDMDERVISIDERMVTKADLADTLKNLATKNDLKKFKEDVLEEVRPIAKAVDKDAVAVVNHEKRIAVLERKVGIATK